MANRAFMIPLRNDLAGSGIYIYDLKPNGSQKNNSLDGVGQSNYLRHNFNTEADNQVVGAAEGLTSGSATRNTLAATAAADVIAPGGNETLLTQATEFGVKCYLRERIHVNPGGNDDTLSQGEVDNLYDDIVARVAGGLAVDLTWLNARLVARAGAATDLDGAGAASNSFGSVEDIVRMMSGEVYRTRDNTCVADAGGGFITLAERQTRVDGNQLAFPVYAQGGFLGSTEVGFRAMPLLALTEAVRLSAKGGVLLALGAAAGVELLRRDFAYTGTTPTAIRPAAVNPWSGATLPATGIAPVCFVYDTNGNRIN